MASVRHEVVIAASPEKVWSAVSDVGAVHRRLLPGRVVETRIEGDRRTLTFPDGGQAEEFIVDVDDTARRLAYAVIRGRMPLTHHHASMQVLPEGPTSSRLVWVTDFLPNSLASEVRSRVEVGAREIKGTIEGQTTPV
jgi:hypothetical protein